MCIGLIQVSTWYYCLLFVNNLFTNVKQKRKCEVCVTGYQLKLNVNMAPLKVDKSILLQIMFLILYFSYVLHLRANF